MLKREIKQMLSVAIDSRDLVRVVRKHIEPGYINGHPLAISEKLCMLKVLNEFHFDGFTIVRLKDITSVFSDENEKFFKSILEREGAFEVDICPSVVIDSWISILTELKSMEANFIIETEDTNNTYFLIGKIEEFKDNAILFHRFDSLGNWIAESKEISFKSITSVTFESEYIKVFSKYV